MANDIRVEQKRLVRARGVEEIDTEDARRKKVESLQKIITECQEELQWLVRWNVRRFSFGPGSYGGEPRQMHGFQNLGYGVDYGYVPNDARDLEQGLRSFMP